MLRTFWPTQYKSLCWCSSGGVNLGRGCCFVSMSCERSLYFSSVPPREDVAFTRVNISAFSLGPCTSFSISGCLTPSSSMDILKDFIYLSIYLFLEGKGGRKRGRETSTGCLLCALTGDLACTPVKCPDQESNQQPFTLQGHAHTTELYRSGPP